MTRPLAALVGLTVIIWVTIYAVFRTSTVLFSFSNIGGPVNQIIMFAFWIAELILLFNALGYFLNILKATYSYKRAALHYVRDSLPKVTVLIPVHNEPVTLLRKTVIAAQYMDYPSFDVVLLDASEVGDYQKQTKQLAKERGVEYFFVPHPRHGAKAGSLNTYLPHITTSTFVIFDADYRASRDFLKRLVPQMEADPRLGFIQTPQFYGNLLQSTVSRAAQMQQSIFYEYICEGKSAKNAMFMCGTNVIIRTEAMRSIGGFVEGSITEDFATSLNLLRAGWKTHYDNMTTAFGEGPQNLEEYFRQQYRWARGTMGVFVREWVHLLLPATPLTLAQRLEFVLAGSYYFVGFVWTILILLPILYIFFSVPVYFSDPVLYLFSYIPYFLLSLTFFIETLLTRRYRTFDWLASQSLFMLSLPVYIRAGIDAVFKRPAKFEQTKKDVATSIIPWKKLRAQTIFLYINTAAIIFGCAKIYALGFSVSLGLNILWACFHEFIFSFFLLYLYVEHKKQSRS